MKAQENPAPKIDLDGDESNEDYRAALRFERNLLTRNDKLAMEVHTLKRVNEILAAGLDKQKAINEALREKQVVIGPPEPTGETLAVEDDPALGFDD